MIVTGIEKNGTMAELFVEGESAGRFFYDLLLACGICRGKEISPDELTALRRKNDTKAARDRALRVLAYRDHTKSELMEKMRGKADPEIVQAVVEQIEQLGLIDEAAYASKLSKELAEKKYYSDDRIFRELRAKGIDEQTALHALEGLLPEEARIELFLEKRLRRKKTDERERSRIRAALFRYGYTAGMIYSIMEKEILFDDEPTEL